MGRKKGPGMTHAQWQRSEWAKKGILCVLFTPQDQIVCRETLELGEWLRELRKEIGLDQGQLAEKLGISRTTISNWENNLKVS